MPKILTLLWIIAATIALTSCSKDPVKGFSDRTNNPELSVDELFTHKGCTVYRFVDGVRPVYFTNCNSTSYPEGCGKGCTQWIENKTKGGQHEQANANRENCGRDSSVESSNGSSNRFDNKDNQNVSEKR